MRRRTGWLMRAALSALALLLLLPTAASAAPNGEITNAYADPNWTTADIAGVARCDGCFGGTPLYTQWMPVLTAQPALPSYSCRGDEWRDSDPDTTVVWSGGSRTTNDPIPFDLQDARILPGVIGQRACLIIVSTIRRQNPVCVAQAPILGYDPSTCPLEETIVETSVAQRIIEQAPAAPPTPPVPAPTPQAPPSPTAPPATAPQPPASGTQPSAPRALTREVAATSAANAARRAFGRSWRYGKRKRVSCTRRSANGYTCVVRWRDRKRARRAVASVSRNEAGKIVARIRATRRTS